MWYLALTVVSYMYQISYLTKSRPLYLRCEAVKHAAGQLGECETVWLWYQWSAGWLSRSHKECWMCWIHGCKTPPPLMYMHVLARVYCTCTCTCMCHTFNILLIFTALNVWGGAWHSIPSVCTYAHFTHTSLHTPSLCTHTHTHCLVSPTAWADQPSANAEGLWCPCWHLESWYLPGWISQWYFSLHYIQQWISAIDTHCQCPTPSAGWEAVLTTFLWLCFKMVCVWYNVMIVEGLAWYMDEALVSVLIATELY